MRDISELGVTGCCTAVDPHRLATFESHAGIRLPQSYRNFLLTTNGGRPALRWFRHGGGFAINKFFHLGDPESDPTRPIADGWDYENLWAELRVRRPWIGDRGVPIANNAGDDILFLDYRREEPVVSVLRASTRQSAELATGFARFIDGLADKPIPPARHREVR